MRRRTWLTMGAIALMVTGGGFMSSGGPAAAQQESSYDMAWRAPRARHCSEATIRGTYGAQMQGTSPVPPPVGGTQTVIGVVLRTYDGAGSFTQVDNVKGSVTGIAPNRPGEGTYEVNPDCTGVTSFDPGTGIPLQERFVIVDHGNEIRSIVSSPKDVMISAVGRRIDHR